LLHWSVFPTSLNNAKIQFHQLLNRNSPNTSPLTVRAMVLLRNINSDSTSSLKRQSPLLKLMLRMVHSLLARTSSPPGLLQSTRDFLVSDNQRIWSELLKRMLRFLIPLISQHQLTGDKVELLTPLKTKVNVDHAGLSQLLFLSKVLTSFKPENFCLSQSNNLLTAIKNLKDAMVDCKNTPWIMLRTTLKN
jgi:hypothetical protein